MHQWGDTDFDWAEFDHCVDWVARQVRRARIPCTTVKEKYGTLRVYCGFGWQSPHDLAYPGWCYYQWPKWTYRINYWLGHSWLWWPVLRLSVWWAKRAYRRIYAGALTRWPQFSNEILADADWPELLEGL